MFMMLEDQYGVGDTIDFEKASGTVEAVGLRTTRLRDVNGTVWYVRNGEVVRVGNKSQGFAQVVLDVPIDAWADVATASQAILDEAEQMRSEDDWSGVFLGDPDMQGVESMTREETVIRLVARTRPGEQFRVAREMRRRIRERLDRMDVGTHEPTASTPPANEPPVEDASAAGVVVSADRADRFEHRAVQRREHVVHRLERRDRHLRVHGEREHRDDLAAVRGDDRRADEHVGVGVDDDLDEAVVAGSVDPAAGVARDLRDAGAYRQTGVARLLLGHADAADLGIGEGRPRERVVAAERLGFAEQMRGEHA